MANSVLPFCNNSEILKLQFYAKQNNDYECPQAW